MKTIYALICIISLLPVFHSAAQNTGIGTSTPQEKLDVNGAIRIGTTASTNAGTIRYGSGVFEGNNGISWNAFTQLPPGTLVASTTNPNTALSNAGFSFFAPVFVNSSSNTTTTPDSWLGIQTLNGPVSRRSHTAVWTGTRMIVWGGYSFAYLNSGSIYNPATDTWSAIASSPLSERYLHTAIWTGTKMIIWGGYNTTGYLNDGAIYDPATNTWTSMSASPLSGRHLHTAVWTGTDMIVWGGTTATGKTNTGAKYNVTGNSWTNMPTANAPTARYFHSAVWTGSKMIVWGGEDLSNVRKNDGAIYDNTSNTWTSSTSTINAPVARYLHTATWTGTEMVVWGGEDPGIGFYNTGGKYDPATNTWTLATSTSNAPALRSGHKAQWTGTEIIVYGGMGPGSNGYTYYNSGGRYNPSTNSWTSIGLNNAPTGRVSHSIVFTGNQMIVFGGGDQNGFPSVTGGRYILNSESNISTITQTALYLFSKN